MRLSRTERVADLCAMHGVMWVESAAAMLGRMTPDQRLRLDRLWCEQTFLLERGKASPRLDSALAEPELERCVAYALANRRLTRRILIGV
jgi:hypothetical protein